MPKLGEIKKAKDIGKNTNPSAKFIWHACEDCGFERWVTLVGGKPRKVLCKKCCHRCERSGKWKGGKSHNSQGYITVMLHPNDPYYPMVDHANYVLEHRLIVAKHLGRCLKPYETVWHKNLIRTDNRLENLILKSPNDYNPYYKIRFTVLERDRFRCQYCGRTPQDGAKLEVDHIHPKSKNGDYSLPNLITSCKECNIGKGDIILKKIGIK